MDELAETRMRYINVAEYIRRHPNDPANMIRKMELLALQNEIRTLEEPEKKEETNG